MKTYTIIRRPAELHWQDVPALQVDECLWLPPADISMQAQVCYDDAALYVRLSVREQNIRAEHKTPGCMVCEDSCMEFFFCPTAGDDRYFNFEWNPNAQLYLGFGPNRCDSVRLLVQDEQAQFAPRPARTADGWELTFRVPVSFVRALCAGLRTHARNGAARQLLQVRRAHAAAALLLVESRHQRNAGLPSPVRFRSDAPAISRKKLTLLYLQYTPRNVPLSIYFLKTLYETPNFVDYYRNHPCGY